MNELSRRSRLTIAVVAAAVLAVVLALSLPPVQQAIGAAFDPSSQATPSAVAAQRLAAERAIQRGYQKAIDQLDATRKLRVSMSAAQMEAILSTAVTDLGALRRDALTALGEALGARGDALARYVAEAETRLAAQAPASAEPGLLLAPRLLAIVQRLDELAAKRADDATRAITVPAAVPSSPPPPASPTPRPTPSPSR